MNYLIKKILVVALFLFASNFIHAQTSVKYEYDAAGNREHRIVLPGKSISAAIDSISDLPPIADWLDKMKITIYPNPTRAEITIDIDNIPQDASGEITIHNTEGKRLQHIDKLNAANQLNLSLYPTGIYILRIRSGQISCEWKIVKE